LSRLKEGERVCGGRGQFGKQPLWNFNTISKLRIQLGRCDMFDLTNWKASAEDQMPSSQQLECARKGWEVGKNRDRNTTVAQTAAHLLSSPQLETC
jgi:hypothetical protein